MVTFLLSIGSWEEIDNRMLVMENRNIPSNIKGNRYNLNNYIMTGLLKNLFIGKVTTWLKLSGL